MTSAFVGLIAIVSMVSGATASVVGFGIGSLLTPLLAVPLGTNVAVAAVVLPHLAGGLVRGVRLRKSVDRGVLIRFGLLSAAGGLAGALVFARLTPATLGRVLGALLVLSAIGGLSGYSERWHPSGPVVWILGALSGFFGGVVGNQGGLRAAALSAFRLEPAVFVATSTVVGVMIDLVRAPIYLHRAGDALHDFWPAIGVATTGVLVGTFLGERLLLGLSRERFRMLVSGAIGLLGLWFLLR